MYSEDNPLTIELDYRGYNAIWTQDSTGWMVMDPEGSLVGVVADKKDIYTIVDDLEKY